MYLPIRTPERDAAPVRDVPARERRQRPAAARPGCPSRRLLLASLVLLWLVQVPLAWRLAGRLRPQPAEREALLREGRSTPPTTSGGASPQTSTTASCRISPGLSYSLSAAADRPAAQTSAGAPATRCGTGHRDPRQRCAASARCSSRSIRRTSTPPASPPRSPTCSRRSRPAGSRLELEVPDELDARRREAELAPLPRRRRGDPERRSVTPTRGTSRCASARRTGACASRSRRRHAASRPSRARAPPRRRSRRALAARGARRRRRREPRRPLAARAGHGVRARGARAVIRLADRRRPRRRAHRAGPARLRRSTTSSSSAAARTGRRPSTLCARACSRTSC